MQTPEALQRLKEGNARFVKGEQSRVIETSTQERASLAAGQTPFAIILGCSDSRAPVELIFDQNLGDLFVVRVAGNIATPTGIGSVEFAAAKFGTRLVIVLGHSHCGAVQATIGEIQNPSEGGSPHIGEIVNHIRPAVEPILASTTSEDSEQVVTNAIRANVSASAHQLRNNSDILQKLIEEEGLQIIGAEYCLKTGKVDFFDGI